MLTAVCLWDAVLDTPSNLESCHEINAQEPGEKNTETDTNTETLDFDAGPHALQDSEGVLCDIQALVGVTDVQSSARLCVSLLT